MAVVVPTTESITTRVALVGAWTHQRRGHLVIETCLGSLVDAPAVEMLEAFVVVEADVVEVVVDAGPDWAALDKAIRRLAIDFNRIVVLVPAPAMGIAHRRLRGAPAVLQQWWLDGDAVRFGVEEAL